MLREGLFRQARRIAGDKHIKVFVTFGNCAGALQRGKCRTAGEPRQKSSPVSRNSVLECPEGGGRYTTGYQKNCNLPLGVAERKNWRLEKKIHS